MKKLSLYALTAATALTITGMIPATAHAATGTYSIMGGRPNIIVMDGSNASCLNEFLGQICNQGSLTCDHRPNFPGINKPDNSLPTPEFPLPEFSDESTPEMPDNGGSMDAYTSQIVKLVNAERAKSGLAPLTVHGGVANAAQVRAREIEKSFSHTRPNGSDFSTALRAEAVNYQSAGENIAYGQKTPEQVMQGWMNSAGHRANILNANFTSIGVGHYRSASGVDYWTQLFMNK